MALFKIQKGPAANLGADGNATAVAHEGFAYFTPDDGKFYIDIQDADEAIIGVNRIPINSVKADKFSSDRAITITGSDITGTGTSNGTSGWSIAASLIDRPGLEAGSYGLANNDSPGYSGTFKIPYFTIDAKGRVIAASEYTITLPAAVENSHYITHLYAGIGVTAENSVSTNGNTKLILTDNAAIRNTITLQGSGAANVTSDNNGVITIYSENTWNLLSTSQPGYVPQAPNDSHKFLRGDATWADITTAQSTSLNWNTESTIATIGGYDIKVTLPSLPPIDSAVTLTGDVTGYVDSSNRSSIITTIGNEKVTNSMLEGFITNNKLVNSKITIANIDVPLGGSISLSDLGLSSALRFKGITTTVMTDGRTTADITINDSSYTPIQGDVVLYEDGEYVWTGSYWEELGRENSFKIKQTAIVDDSGTAESTTATRFIYSISQTANGEISVKTRPLPDYITRTEGVTDVAWNNLTKYITKTINGTTSNVVKIEQGTEASLTMPVDEITETLSFSWTTNVPTTVTAP